MKTKRIIAGFVALACILLAILTLSSNSSKHPLVPSDSAEVARIMALTNLSYNDALSDSKLKALHCGTIQGLVIDKETGKPMVDDLVRAYDSRCKESACIESTLTASDGSFRMAVPAGQETVIASSITRLKETDQYNMKLLNISEADRKKVKLAVSTAGESSLVAGVVYGPGGKPFPGARVAVYNQQYRFPTSTDSNGSFAFEEPGLVRTAKIYALAGDMGTVVCANLTHGPNVKLHLVHNAACSVTGTVLNSKHAPVVGAIVEIFMRDSDGTMFPTDEMPTDQHGAYLFSSLFGIGNYVLTVYRQGFVPWQTKDDIPSGIGKKITVAPVILTDGTGCISGIVVNPYGALVPGAVVSAEEVQGHRHRSVVTDPAGKFYLGGFQGRYIAISVTTLDQRYCVTTVTSGRTKLKLRVMNSLESAAIIGRN